MDGVWRVEQNGTKVYPFPMFSYYQFQELANICNTFGESSPQPFTCDINGTGKLSLSV